MIRIFLTIVLFVLAFPVFAQDTEQADRSYFIGFVEDQLSSPNRQIRINNIQGVLSSNATIGEITIADRDGVWLRIVNARIVWTRSALLLGRLDIDTLSADRIDVLRKPLPDESAPAPEAGGFQIPELPISVSLDALEVPHVTFGQDVFGLASEMAITGRLQLAGGSLDTALNVTRLDGPGGQLALSAAYANASQVLNLDLKLDEPANGVVANLLNIEGRPPVALALQGKGPLAELDLALTLDADAERVLTGTTQLRRQADGLAFTTNVEGPITRLISPRFREFFGSNTTLQAAGLVKDAGGMVLENLDLESAALKVQAAAETAADGFLQRLMLDANIDNGTNEKVLLPVPGENTVQRANVKLAFGDRAGDEWSGSIRIDDLATETFSSRSVEILLSGLAQNIATPAERHITFAATGGASGIVATRADVTEALGDRITLDVAGEWTANTPIKLAKALVAAKSVNLSLAGDIAEYAFKGDIGVQASTLAPFSALAGRDLSGGIDLAAKGELQPLTGGFDLALDGTATGLGIDSPAVDNLLEGETRITGGIARGEAGLVARQLRLFNDQVTLAADGSFATGAANFGFDVSLSDLALVSEKASGKLTAKGRAAGSDGLIGLTFGAEVPTGALVGKTLKDAVIGFEGTLQEGDLNGQLTGNAFLDGVRVELASALALTEAERRLGDLRFTAGGAKITGDVTQTKSGLLEGNLSLAAADVSTAAALLLRGAKGAVNADIVLSHENSRQNATIRADVDALTIDTIRLGKAELNATVADLFNVPIADGTLDARDISAGGIDVSELQATARQEGQTTNFKADATLKNGTRATAAGALSPIEGGYRLALQTAEVTQGSLAARLIEPAALQMRGQTISIDNLLLDVGGGRLSARGEIADKLDLDVDISNLPLAIANTMKPDLALAGTVNGKAAIGGTRTSPDISFTAQGRGIAAAALRQAGLKSINLDADGTSSASRLNVKAAITSPEGLRATVNGAVPLDQGALALDVGLEAFPLAVLNAVAPGQNLGGTLSGTARLSGQLANPAASFTLRGTGVRAAALETAGAAPLEISASGSYADKVLTLSSATASGPQGLSVSASGRLPISGNGLDLSVKGEAPLALANRFLAERGAQAGGTLQANATISGNLSKPAIRGMFSTQGAELVDPESNVRLRSIAIMGTIDGDRVTIRNASANLAAGGSIAASGTISLDAAAAFPADIRITLNDARYADGNLVVATLGGTLAVTGGLARDPLISGNITVSRAEITVPDSFAGGAAALDVKHIRPPAGVAATLKRAHADDGTPTPTSRPSVARLDIAVSAPNRIFVRGRGLDTELGGTVRLTGPVTDIQPVGGFELIRGRLGILGQRITFDEGTVTLVGDLDPFLNFVARSGGNDITVFITVTGRASDIAVEFSSQPELPQDEVLARLIFNRGINELSAFQIAQLAAAAAELAGGSDTSLLGSLRGATGLDDLDVVTDSEGNAALRAGRYIQDNIYLGVEAGAHGSTRGTVNLDITDDLKARGAVGTGGDSSLGIFYEKDY
ncbi:translocation/assembly module TamB domain-containing protein [Pseudaminobacter sp. NGMCC 1.201702]|uniref:translocation/assembly module TamB domain-containing protein n=1 Tax=Pseudaminobacter sp. NGMCC 1.201702 TaxID=3391825 RepID=UPI0039F041F8